MPTRQSSGKPPSSSSDGSGRPENAVVPILFACILIGAAGPAVGIAASGRLMPWLQRGATAAARGVAEWWAENWMVVAFWAVVAVGVVVWRSGKVVGRVTCAPT